MTEPPPVVTIAAVTGGWLVSCPCGMERHCARRPAADRIAADHRKAPHIEKPASTFASKPKPRASWADREDSTWIDKL